MLTKARVKNFKNLSSLCPKKISIMNSPRRPLFSEIKQKGQYLYKAASNLCNAQEKLAATREQLKFNLRCKRQNVTPKSLRFRAPIQSREALEYFRTTVPKQCLHFFINDDHRRIRELNQ